MSYCREEGKDRIIFVTEEEHSEDPKQLDDYDDEKEGLLNQDGSINWDCPCLGGMASGPCGVEFRQSFSCFHYSTEEVKGSNCIDEFRSLQDCMSTNPDYYTRRSHRELDEGEDDGKENREESKDIEKDSSEDSRQTDATKSASDNEGKDL